MWHPAIEHGDALAAAILAGHGVAAHAPVEVRALAAAYGISVRAAPRGPDGRLVHDRDGTVVFLNDTRPATRQRFTLAHELGHWALGAGFAEHPAAVAARRDVRSEEVACNAVAGALLLPAAWLWSQRRELWDARRETLAELSDVARTAQTSLEATIVRLHDRCGWTSALLHFTRRRHERPGRPSWRLLTEAGVHSGRPGSIAAAPETAWQLSALAPGPIHPVALRLYEHGTARDVDCDVWIRERDAVVLARAAPSDADPAAALGAALRAVFHFKTDLLDHLAAAGARALLGELEPAAPKARIVAHVLDAARADPARHGALLERVATGVAAMERFPQLARADAPARRTAWARRCVMQLRRALGAPDPPPSAPAATAAAA